MYYAGQPFDYNENHLESGELFMPRGAMNDGVLIARGYLVSTHEAMPAGYEEYKCMRCGKAFVSDSYKYQHDQKCPQGVVVVDGEPQGIDDSGRSSEPVTPAYELIGEKTAKL
jgi:hypothetical protein